jgi:hypothetical protein
VLEHVGEAFLDDPVGGDVEAARQREAISGDAQPDGQSGAACLIEQPSETVELTALIRTRLRRMQCRPGLIDGFLAKTGLDLAPFVNPRN